MSKNDEVGGEQSKDLQYSFASSINSSSHRSLGSLAGYSFDNSNNNFNVNSATLKQNKLKKTKSGNTVKKSEVKKYHSERDKKKSKRSSKEFSSFKDFSFIKKEEEDDSFLEGSPNSSEELDEQREDDLKKLRKVLSNDELKAYLSQKQKQKESLRDISELKSTIVKKTKSERNSSEENVTNIISEETRKKNKKKYKKHARALSLPGTTENSDEETEIENSNSYRRFQRRFQLPDEVVIDTFICALLLRGALLSQGTMYITQNFLCFYSNIFGKKTRVKVPFSDMISLRKCRILKSIPNSIEVHTQTKKYFWASFIHRDNAYTLINSRWRECRTMLGNPVLDENMSEELDLEQNSEEIGYSSGDDSKSENSTDMLFLRDLRLPPSSIHCSHEINISSETNEKYSKVYPINILEFYQIFFSDESEMFWKEFHSRGGYQKFSMTQWSPSAEGCCCERHADFTAPLPLSIAPKYTRIAQQHRIRMIDQNQMIFETSSHSKDVPYSSHFLVEAKWILTNLDKRNCELKIFITVNFTKKIWLKSMIEHNAIEGSKDWYIDFIKAAMRYVKLRKAPKINSSSSVINRNSTVNLEILRKSLSQLPDDLKLNKEKKNVIDKVKMKKDGRNEGVFQEVYKFSRLIQQSNPKVFLIILIITIVILLFSSISILYLFISNSSLESNLLFYRGKNIEFQTTQSILKILNSAPEKMESIQNEFLSNVRTCNELLDNVQQHISKLSDHKDISTYLSSLD